jgi:hypothetical protein
MRKLLPLVLVSIAGCGYGPARMRPGSDMVLPEHVSVGESLLRSLACSAQKSDSLRRTPAAQGQDVRASCGAVRDPVTR